MMQQPADTTIVERATEAVTATAARAGAVWDITTDPLFWFVLGGRALKVAITIALALLVISLIKRAITRWEAHVKDLPPLTPRRQRVMTVSNLILSMGRYVIWVLAAIMVLAQVGVNIAPLLAGAGIAGLAIGFGAQTLVRDVISGLFLLFDDIIHIGDLITFDGHAGVVEGISLRLIKVRKFDGELMMVPAGELRAFGNKSVGFARVVVPVGVTYEQDTDTVLEALERVAAEWAARPNVKAIMLEPAPQVQALMELGDSAVTARIVVQVIPGEQFAAERELRKLVKRRFDEWGIEIPFPRRTMYVRQEPEPPAREITLPPLPEPEDDGHAGAD
jgi:moderate conductance mechanosensitive channel